MSTLGCGEMITPGDRTHRTMSLGHLACCPPGPLTQGVTYRSVTAGGGEGGRACNGAATGAELSGPDLIAAFAKQAWFLIMLQVHQKQCFLNIH